MSANDSAAAAEAEAETPLRLSYFTTGTVLLRPSQRSQPTDRRPVLLRRLRSFTDRSWTAPMPIGVFVVHHPSGPILFDTGESPRFNERDYLPFWNVLPKMVNRLSISEAEGVVPQLRALGVEPSALRAVVLSHLHHDHAGGLEALAAAAPDVPVLVGPAHWAAFGERPARAAVQGCAPNRWPAGFEPRLLEPEPADPADGLAPWTTCYPVTADRRVVAVDTPGHVPGHLSLVVRGADAASGRATTYLLCGDATYGLDLLEAEETDGINGDPREAVRSLRRIKEFCRARDVVVLPSHDADVARLLAERVVYKPKSPGNGTESP